MRGEEIVRERLPVGERPDGKRGIDPRHFLLKPDHVRSVRRDHDEDRALFRAFPRGLRDRDTVGRPCGKRHRAAECRVFIKETVAKEAGETCFRHEEKF